MKLSEILQLEVTLSKIKDKDLPFKVVYQLTKLYKFAEENKQFYTDNLKKIIDKYSEKDEAGNPVALPDNDGIKIAPEYINNAQREINELMVIDIDIPDIKLDIDKFEDMELSLSDMNCLMPFFN